MATVFLPRGLPGAGKTTLARMLESERPALRLTPDEWMARVVGDGYDDVKRAAVEALLWEVGARALALGVDVVLDFGVWARSERDSYRAKAVALGANTRICFLDVPREELLRRLALRNANLPADTFTVTTDQLDLYFTWFEPPTSEELA